MEFTEALFAAAGLGILSTLQPCQLTFNLALITSLGSFRVRGESLATTALLYMLGRITGYMAAGGLILTTRQAFPELLFFLSKGVIKLMGPLLIILGMLLTDLFPFRLKQKSFDGLFKAKEKGGVLGALFMGLFHSMAFCPVTAGFFFGVILPASLPFRGELLFSGLFGAAAAFPVCLGLTIIALPGKSYQKINRFISRPQTERILHRITGIIIILIGIGLSLQKIILPRLLQ